MLTNILRKCGKNEYDAFLSLRGPIKIADKEIGILGFSCCLRASLCVTVYTWVATDPLQCYTLSSVRLSAKGRIASQ